VRVKIYPITKILSDFADLSPSALPLSKHHQVDFENTQLHFFQPCDLLYAIMHTRVTSIRGMFLIVNQKADIDGAPVPISCASCQS